MLSHLFLRLRKIGVGLLEAGKFLLATLEVVIFNIPEVLILSVAVHALG